MATLFSTTKESSNRSQLRRPPNPTTTPDAMSLLSSIDFTASPKAARRTIPEANSVKVPEITPLGNGSSGNTDGKELSVTVSARGKPATRQVNTSLRTMKKRELSKRKHERRLQHLQTSANSAVLHSAKLGQGLTEVNKDKPKDLESGENLEGPKESSGKDYAAEDSNKQQKGGSQQGSNGQSSAPTSDGDLAANGDNNDDDGGDDNKKAEITVSFETQTESDEEKEKEDEDEDESVAAAVDLSKLKVIDNDNPREVLVKEEGSTVTEEEVEELIDAEQEQGFFGRAISTTLNFYRNLSSDNLAAQDENENAVDDNQEVDKKDVKEVQPSGVRAFLNNLFWPPKDEKTASEIVPLKDEELAVFDTNVAPREGDVKQVQEENKDDIDSISDELEPVLDASKETEEDLEIRLEPAHVDAVEEITEKSWAAPLPKSTNSDNVSDTEVAEEIAALALEDTNLANYGSKEHHDAVRDAAATDPALANCGKVPGLEIWRVENSRKKVSVGKELGFDLEKSIPDFKINKWPEEMYGKFYEGDSYIVLNSYLDNEKKLMYDVHFWLGKESTQDEKGVAAYKTVEIDELLSDVPIQHREVQGKESALFLSYFTKSKSRGVQYLKGGIDSGFHHTNKDEYKPKLFVVKQQRKIVRIMEVPCEWKSLSHDYCYVLDAGDMVSAFYGDNVAAKDRFQAAVLLNNLDRARFGHAKKATEDHFFDHLAPEGKDRGARELIDESDEVKFDMDDKVFDKDSVKVFKLSDESGKMEFEQVNEKKWTYEFFLREETANDVFVVHCNTGIFVWIGQGASKGEKQEAMKVADLYMESQGLHEDFPVMRIKQSQAMKSNAFMAVFPFPTGSGRY